MTETSAVMRLKEPTKCHLWQHENLSSKDLDFELIENYVDSSHLSRALIKCKRCGQLYYSEFYEIIDWDNGNDEQYCTYIPIEPDKDLINLLNQKSPLELLGISPRLQWDNDYSIKWIGKKG